MSDSMDNIEGMILEQEAPAATKSSTVSIEELTKIMEERTLCDDPRKPPDQSTKLVKAYLIKNEPEFVRVTEYRDRVCHVCSYFQSKNTDQH